MVYKILLFFFCFLTLKTTAEKHTVYVSVCEVYNIKNRLVFSFRIFKNDLYDALKIKNTKSKPRFKKKCLNKHTFQKNHQMHNILFLILEAYINLENT